MRWLAIHLPEIAAQVFCRADVDDTPLAVCAAGGRRSVLAVNHAARSCGIAPGASLACALALAPGLAVRDRNPQAEADLLAELAGWSYQFSSCISIDPPDCVLLEIAGSLRLFGGLAALHSKIAAGVADIGLVARLACAPTPLAARWLARCAAAPAVLHTEDLVEALSAIPLADLESEGAPLELMRRIGAVTLGDYLALPRSGLAQRGAREFNRKVDRALDRLPDPRIHYTPPPKFSARIELPSASERDDVIVFASRRLFASLCVELGRRSRAIAHFTLTLEHEDHPPTQLTIHLGSACRDEPRLALLTREHLAARALPAPAVAVRVEACDFLESPGANATLFGPAQDGGEARAVLLARLRARLGEAAVTSLHTRADHRPEWACTRHTQLAPVSAPSEALSNPRPLWLLDQPLLIAAAGRTPWAKGQLTALSGPERIESGWWDQHEARRDYYIAEDRSGALLWVFQDLQPPHAWYLHGIFS